MKVIPFLFVALNAIIGMVHGENLTKISDIIKPPTITSTDELKSSTILPQNLTHHKEVSIKLFSNIHQNHNNATTINNVGNHPISFNDSLKVNESTNFYDVQMADSLHDTFLLLSSVNSIRFWSLDCPIHQSNTLFINSARKSYIQQFGISGMSIYQTPNNSVQLLWFDVPEYQLYRASIIRVSEPSTDCARLLRVDDIKPVKLDSNPKLDDPSVQNFIHLTIDSPNGRIFISNLLQNRIDIYRIDSESLAQNELQWLDSFKLTSHPKDIQADSNRQILFWIESWNMICQMNYGTNSTKLTKNCTESFVQHKPVAMVINPTDSQIIWADKSGFLMMGDYQLRFESQAKAFYQSSLVPIIGLAMNKKWLFIHEQYEVQLIDLNKIDGQRNNVEKTVLIESQVIFETLLVKFDQSSDNNVIINDEFFKSKTVTAFVDQSSAENRQKIEIDSQIWIITILLSTALLISICIVVLIILYYAQNLKNSQFSTPWFKFNLCNWSIFPVSTTDKMTIGDGDAQPQLSGSTVNHATKIRHISNNIVNIKKSLKNAKKNGTNDIEDLAPMINDSDSVHSSFSNPFQPTCQNCREPEFCQGQRICLATYRENL